MRSQSFNKTWHTKQIRIAGAGGKSSRSSHRSSVLLSFHARLYTTVFLSLHTSRWVIHILLACIYFSCIYLTYCILCHSIFCRLFVDSSRISFVIYLFFSSCLSSLEITSFTDVTSFSPKVFYFELLTSSKVLCLFLTTSACICLKSELFWSLLHFSLGVVLDFFNFHNFILSLHITGRWLLPL